MSQHPNSLANLAPAKPGDVRNPLGIRSAGKTIREWINVLAQKDLTEAQLWKIVRDPNEPWTRRSAATRIVRSLERGDLADMENVLDGSMSLRDLRATGYNTEVVKKVKKKNLRSPDGEKIGEEIEVELFDRSGIDFDRIVEKTDGKDTQRIETEGTLNVNIPVAGPLRSLAETLRGECPTTAPDAPPAE